MSQQTEDTTTALRKTARAAQRQNEIEIRLVEAPLLPYFHTRCRRYFETLDEALTHDNCAAGISDDERALVDGFLKAESHDRMRERTAVREALIKQSRVLTEMRDKIDQAFSSLSALFDRLNTAEHEQMASEGTLKSRRERLMFTTQPTKNTREGGE